MPTLDRIQFAATEGLRRGACVSVDAPNDTLDIILIGTGSEVSLINAACQKLTEKKINVRIVSTPSWKLFDAQPRSYRDSVLRHQRAHGLRLKPARPKAGASMWAITAM